MDDEMKKPSFLVYYDNEIIVLRLPDEEAGMLFKSLFPYGKERIVPDFDANPALAMAFDILRMAIDRDKEKYVKRCEKNRENIRKRWDNTGKQSNTSVYDGNQSNTNYTDKDKDKDKDKDMDKDNKDICTEPEESVSMPPVISLILNDKSFHDIYQTDIDGWKELYPAVDVLQELRKMKGWLDSNPAKRKTQRGIKRFINGWLAREQDRSGARGGIGSLESFAYEKSDEEIEAEIYEIAHAHISEKAFDRYHDKLHELICLCCPVEDFTQEQIDYMLREWGRKPVQKKDIMIAPYEDIFSYWDNRLYDEQTDRNED